MYSATWGHAFDYYGLELYPAPMSDFLSSIGQPSGSARIAASGHRLWAGIVSTPIESCRIHWCGEEHGAPTPVPDAVHLQTATGQVWIAAGRSATYPPDGRIHLGTDDVLVIFDDATTARAGLGARLLGTGTKERKLGEVAEVLAAGVLGGLKHYTEPGRGRHDLDPTDAGSFRSVGRAEELFDALAAAPSAKASVR
ncbi:hypothetical protein [Catenulispora rubra]|uniref:hypothetical protein n=1 Tax=Catenulispora rubra TaxID=280293 RepID=UPI001891F843|nr:hypothetical protein [Catenulispora rubra]